MKNSESTDLEDSIKAAVQLLLAKNYDRAQRYDIARTEFTTVINKYPKTSQAIEAEFGIGEGFMAQKVYDQAEAIFERLALSTDRDVAVRAEFLRGVLASRRGDRDRARDIFRGVLDRVPNLELANQALFNLSEVYGAEKRYMDQLELLRTVGRLGRASKRWHAPGTPLSIVVQDSDLGISRGHTKIPVRITTDPGGDEELVFLYSGGAGKGLFRADLETVLGRVTKRDGTLQLTGKDSIKVDYPEEFKAEFKSVPLSDADIRVASNGKMQFAARKTTGDEEETFSQRLQREALEREATDLRRSQRRPDNQVKPGNPLYLHVEDPDRDLTDEPDTITVKLSASSGDEVQQPLVETGSHTGIFEAVAKTAELPAGATASDMAIDHAPLMAIDEDPATSWMSQPDGATPKWLSIDMKSLNNVDHVVVHTPDKAQHSPVRGEVQGSHDGRIWFRIASQPPLAGAPATAGEFAHMNVRVFPGNFAAMNDWKQVVDATNSSKPIEQADVESIDWRRAGDAPDANQPFGIVWQGKVVQEKSSAVRWKVDGDRTAIWVDGHLELELGGNGRTVDLWLNAGTHDVVFFSAVNQGRRGAFVQYARPEQIEQSGVVHFQAFRVADFDLNKAKPAKAPTEPVVKVDDLEWDFSFAPQELRFVRFVVREYRGDSVAIDTVKIASEAEKQVYIPSKVNLLSMSSNDCLELAASDTLTASYLDEVTQNNAGGSQLLTATLTATYFNGTCGAIAYDFARRQDGTVDTYLKQVMRIEPGERIVVQVTDFDRDESVNRDEIKIQVQVNDGPPVELTATETESFSGIFTKEVDTREAESEAPAAKAPAKDADGKTAKPVSTGGKRAKTKSSSSDDRLAVKPGDKVFCRYLDAQNTFPGHAVQREATVYVNSPTAGKLRIIDTRVAGLPGGQRGPQSGPPQIAYLPEGKEQSTAHVAFEAPLTVEVIDPDAAKDSKSSVVVQLATSGGSKVDVRCLVSGELRGNQESTDTAVALEDGRFVGQISMQLGSSASADLIPLTANMPRNLIGGGVLPAEDDDHKAGELAIVRVLNLSGKDTITATYKDALRPEKSPPELSSDGRLIANGTLACTDHDYEKEIKQLHVGERIYLIVADADLDATDERDFATLTVSSELGEKETVKLEETLSHSGVFTGSLALKPSEKPTPGNLNQDDPAIETYFGDTIKVTYIDPAASTESGKLELIREIPVVVGTDGRLSAFSKLFEEDTLAVETQFHIAESYFELFKSHKSLGRKEEQQADLEAGRRVLREVMQDYPSPRHIPRIAYLLGQFSQELQQWNEAISSYQLIVRQFPESTLAADAQYKLAQCHEEAGDFEAALEAYVTLAATYPKSPLIANVMVRISDYFYKKENYAVSASVGEKFLEKFDGHEWSPRIAFRVGQCHYKGKQYEKAAAAFDKFVKSFPDDTLCADALFWAGESHRMKNDMRVAFTRYNRCRWDFPSSDAAKYARGRLALPDMLRQFETESTLEQ